MELSSSVPADQMDVNTVARECAIALLPTIDVPTIPSAMGVDLVRTPPPSPKMPRIEKKMPKIEKKVPPQDEIKVKLPEGDTLQLPPWTPGQLPAGDKFVLLPDTDAMGVAMGKPPWAPKKKKKEEPLLRKIVRMRRGKLETAYLNPNLGCMNKP